MQSRPLPSPDGPESLSVLAIDDEVLVRDVLRDTLAEAGYQVTLVSSAEEALQLLRDASFDCILSDVNLPGMDGLAFLSLLKSLHPSVPVILIAGIADVDLARAAIQQGASDFVTKPIDVRSLPIVVERNMERTRIASAHAEEQTYRTRFGVIQALAAAIDAKESYTAEHSRRVTAIATAIGRRMNLADEDLALLEMAALVHDVGKIGVPDDILNKAGPLDEREWSVMREHSAQGAEIVGRVPELHNVAEIVRHHHERIDGTGYPDRLSGGEIPALSRVIAVADAFECMTGDRVYREAYSTEEAIRRLEEGGDSQFDSAVVRTFIHVEREGIEW